MVVVRQLKSQPDLQSEACKSRCAGPPNFMFRPVRRRVLHTLENNASTWPKVLSIVAPIGYGKTVLMSELFVYVQQSGEHCYWIGLDDRDVDMGRVLSAAEAVLRDRSIELHLMAGGEAIEGRAETLLRTIAQLPVPSTIFIDNLNSCSDEALGDFLDALIFRTAPSTRFVWSSSAELPFSVARAKLQGLIHQIGFSELSLNHDETHQLLGSDLSDRIGPSGVELLMKHTEGWPAAIRLAQILLLDTEEPLKALESFSGSDEDITALLNRQVLKGFTPKLRDFVLRLAQLRTFSTDLARLATGSKDVDQYLDFLLQRNVFIIPLDRNRKWYRLHGLFREFLLKEARRSISPEIQRQVLQRAADWCGQNNEWRDAIDYALAAGDTDMASRMLDRTATIFVRDRGDIELYIGWVERLQSEQIQIGWETHFWYVWALIFHRRYESGRLQQERLAARLRRHSGTLDDAPKGLSQRIDYLSICLNVLTDRQDETLRAIERWQPGDESGDYYNIGSVAGLKGICLASAFKFSQARQTLRYCSRILHEVGGPYGLGCMSVAYGTISIYEGNYLQAHQELTTALSHVREHLGEDAVVYGTLAFVDAKCAVEMGLDEEAREMFALGLRKAHGHWLVDAVACGFDSAVKLWKGRTDDFVSISHLREVASSYPPRLSLMLSCYLVQRLLRLGRLKEALVEANLVGLDAEGEKTGEHDQKQLEISRYRDLFAATAIDLLVATSKLKEAEPLIAREFRIAKEEGRVARLVELGLTKAAIAMQRGDRESAAEELIHAIRRAAQRGIVRPFRDQADVIASLVNDTKPTSWSFALGLERTFFAKVCGELPINNPVLAEHLLTFGKGEDPQVALTKREAELLSLINLGLSNQQIADHTNATIGTVKWHLKNIFRKFGVSSRSAALARARALNLFS